MLKHYLDERRRRFAKGVLTKSENSSEWAYAELLWNDLRGEFITRQNLNMHGSITIKVIFELFGKVYFSKEGGPYYRLIRRNPYRPETVIRIIFELADDDGIAVSWKREQTVSVMDSDAHMSTFENIGVYEFTYTPESQ